MSTLPRDASHDADTAPLFISDHCERSFDALIKDFAVAAEEVGMVHPSIDEMRHLYRQVADLAAKLFPGETTFKIGRDWEIPDDIYFVVDVSATGSADEIVAQVNEWHLAMHRIMDKRADLFCLSFHVS